MVGIPDGLGAFDNGDGTFTLVMNHEIANSINSTTGAITPTGVLRASGNAGAFVSLWQIDKATLKVLNVQYLIPNDTSIYLSNNDPANGVAHTGYLVGSTTLIGRLCSGDLAPVSAYSWTDPDTGTTYGTTARIFQSGEETGGFYTSINGPGNMGPESRVDAGRQFAWIVTDDPNIAGNQARTAYELPNCGLFDWENNLANPFSQRKTITIGDDDTSPAGQLYVWVGEKQTTGNVVERAGLTRQSDRDNLFSVRVDGLAPDSTGATNEDRATPLNGTFSLVKEGDVSGLTFAGLENLSNSKGATKFLRPEDGAWDPTHPNDYYFVTTDRLDTATDGVGTQVGRSRLYRLHFTDITNPQLGGTITNMLDGTEGQNMFDNITVDKFGRIILLEDTGNAPHNAKVWMYEVATDRLVMIGKHDPARFGDINVAPTAPFTVDEESSGVIDVSDILGPGRYLIDVQAHYEIPGELVEGGQLLAITVPTAPAWSGSQINDGTSQRSLVSSVTVSFKGNVPAANVPPSAFTLTRKQGGSPIQVNVGNVSFDGTQTHVVLTFSGTSVGNSLPDGNYTLTIDGGKIKDDLGQALDAD
jgi:hypothetical protein